MFDLYHAHTTDNDRIRPSASQQRVQQQQAARAARIAVHNPLTSGTQRPTGPEEPTTLHMRLETNWRHLLAHSVRTGTAETYTTGWRHFLRMCTSLHCDPFLTTPYAGFPSQAAHLHHLDYRVVMILNFIAYLTSPQSTQQDIKPDTIKGYVTAVRHHMRIHLLDISFFEHPLIQQARVALNIVHAPRELVKDRKTLAFTIDMLLHAQNHVLDTTTTHGRLTLLAMKFQYTLLLRRGELLVTADDHYLRAEDVCFVLQRGTTPVYEPPHMMRPHYRTSLRAMIVTIRSAKADQEGTGARTYIDVHDVTHPDVAYCLTSDAFLWACEAQPRGTDAFLSHSGAAISYDIYRHAIKRVAQRMCLDPSRYSTHSLRIGGASALAAAGHPDWFIKKMGRWKSLAFLMYIQFSVSSMRQAYTTLVSPTCFTIADMIALHPGAAT